MNIFTKSSVQALLACAVLTLTGCQYAPKSTSAQSTPIRVDGSSTVYLLTEAVAEDFQHVHRGRHVTVGISGTGGGMKKFVAREIDIANASRRIKPAEAKKAETNGVDFVELPVAYDGICLITNKRNDFVDHLTIAELKRIWEPNSQVRNWSDIRPEWPDQEIHLYGPGTDSGTFDYFTEAIVGKERASRSDYTASEDDNILVRGVVGDTGALGYLGYGYYEQNKDVLRVIPIKNGDKTIHPSASSIASGEYKPLSRPLYIYINSDSASRPEVAEFVSYYLEHAPNVAGEVGYLALPKEQYVAALTRFRANARIAGMPLKRRQDIH